MPQRISTEILPQMVNDQIEDRLPSISDQIMSRSRLERIITDSISTPTQRARGAIMEDIVQRMRTTTSRSESKGAAHNRSASRTRARTRDRAQGHRAAGVALHRGEPEGQGQSCPEHERVPGIGARGDQGQAAGGREAGSQTYKKRYAGQLPSQAESNQQAIQNAQLQLQTVGATINRARERRLFAQQQLADAQNTPVAASPILESAGAGSAAPQLTAAQQLDAAEAALAAAKRRYTPDHPDIRTMERAIKDLRAKAEAEAREPQAAKPTRPLSAAELARQKRIRDLEGEMAIIDQQIASAEREERSPQGHNCHV